MELCSKNNNFSNLASLVALKLCFSLQDSSDAPFVDLFYLILDNVKFEE